MAGQPSTLRTPTVLLALMTVLFVVLGWTGIDYCLPHAAMNDEIVYYSQYRALVEEAESPETRRRFVAYPSLWVRAAVHLPRAAIDPDLRGTAVEVARATADFAFLRRCVVLLASLAIPATWLLARPFVGGGWALVAAALTGTSALFFSLATQARPHGVALPAIVLAVAAAARYARQGTFGASLAAAFAGGAPLAVLQNGIAAVLALAAAHVVRLRAAGRRALPGVLVSAVVVGAIYLVAYPAELAKLLARTYAGSTRHGFLASHGVVLEDFQGGGTIVVLRAMLHHDPLLFAAAAATLVAGVVLLGRGRRPLSGLRPELAVVLAFAVPYLVALCLFERTFYRFALPLVPCAALFAVIGLRALGRAGAFVAAGMLVTQAACLAQIVRLHVAGDTNARAADWIATNLDRGADRLAISPWLDLPLLRTSSALAAHGLASHEEVAPWLDHQRAMDPAELDRHGWSIVDLPLRSAAQRAALLTDPAAFVRGLEADLLVLDVFPGNERPILARVRDGARAAGELVARFLPRGDGEASDQVDPYVSMELFARDRLVLQVWDARLLGTGIEIYRIAR
jgi:hypothetical protein